MWEGHNELALKLLKNKLLQDSTNTEILATIALAYYNINEMEKADSIIKIGLTKNSKDPYFNEVQGVIYVSFAESRPCKKLKLLKRISSLRRLSAPFYTIHSPSSWLKSLCKSTRRSLHKALARG